MSDSQSYASKAEEMEQAAAKATSVTERQNFERLAAAYRQLANDAAHFEKRFGARDKPD